MRQPRTLFFILTYLFNYPRWKNYGILINKSISPVERGRFVAVQRQSASFCQMKQILIVEDAQDLSRFLQSTLTVYDPGWSVKIVPSGEEALLETKADLLVCDLRLPGISGVELVRKLRMRNPDLKVIFISGLSEETATKMIKDVKAEGFLKKPIDINRFIDLVRRSLGLPAGDDIRRAGESIAALEGRRSLAEVLAELRQSLRATVVYLLDDRGRVTAQTGELAEAPLAEWVNGVMAVLSGSDKLVQVLGISATLAVHSFRNEEYDLVMAPVGAGALLIVLRRRGGSLRLAMAVEEAMEAQRELALIVGEPVLVEGTPVSAAAEPVTQPVRLPDAPPPVVASAPAAIEEEAELGKLEDILSSPEKVKKGKDLNAFWDSAIGTAGAGLETPDGLSYDQASQLGLTPPDKE